MLSQRIIAGVTMAAVFLASLWWMPAQWFHGLLAVVALYAAWEWGRLVATNILLRIAFILICGFVGLSIYVALDADEQRQLLLTTCLYWGAVLFMLLSFQTNWIGRRSLSWFCLFSGILFLPMGWWSLVQLYDQGKGFFVYLMAVVWLADSAAYFAGRSLGKRKLAPDLSPGKTVEGAGGAVITIFVLALLTCIYLRMPVGVAVYFVFLSLAVMLISIVGDLFESMLKRNADVKDSGNLIPGHGGVLDRIDSLIAAAPVFALGMYAG